MFTLYKLVITAFILVICSCSLPKYSLELINNFNSIEINESSSSVYVKNISSSLIVEISYSVNSYSYSLNKVIAQNEVAELYSFRDLYDYGFVEIIFIIDNVTLY